jgi:phenylalanyl-tRNA synthetase alpha chain
MSYQNADIARVAEVLRGRSAEGTALLRAPELKSLFDQLKTLPPEQRGSFGKELNQLKQELTGLAQQGSEVAERLAPIDVTAPFDVNTPTNARPRFLSSDLGSKHPITAEIALIADIFRRMGFVSEESRLLDDSYHMFDSLNFPEGHPARDDYDSFITTEGLIAPAHTSTMQNRYLRKYKANLEVGEPIAVLVPDRVFRNEDLDARHEHTFYQHEGIYVDKGVTVGMLEATLKAFFQEYYQKELEVKTQPFYFPFTEPSLEFAASCMFCDKKGCNICSYSGWIELGGCGMIHPNVLKMAGIDPTIYTGFAWGFGIERPIMLKYGVEDIRHFESGKLEFLRQFP